MSHNRHGFASIIIIVVVVAVIGVIGFFVLKQGNVTSVTNQSLPGLTEADFSFIDDDNLKKHFVAQSNQSTYRTSTYSDAADMTFVMEVEVKGEGFNTRDIEYQPEDRETKHKVQIGNTTYVKDYSDNKWWKQTNIPEELPDEEISEEEEEPIDFKEEYSQPDLKFEFLGKEACGPSASSGLMCFKYKQLTGGPEEMAFDRVFWFDDQKYLLRKDEVTVGEFTNTIEYSYDGINVAAPSPTKDVPAGKSIYDYLYSNNQAAPAMPQEQFSDYEVPTDLPTDFPTDFPPLPDDYSESY